MMRQLGKPTVFLTMSAELNWIAKGNESSTCFRQKNSDQDQFQQGTKDIVNLRGSSGVLHVLQTINISYNDSPQHKLT